MVQIIVYTGAIMMLFLFVLMLVGRDASDSLIETLRGQRVAAILLGLGFAGLVGGGVYRALDEHRRRSAWPRPTRDGNVQGIAELLFTRYVFAFEVTSALLITAAVGAMVLAHIERTKGERRTQPAADAGALRARQLPAARSPARASSPPPTSVATPARLPDGTVCRAQHLADRRPAAAGELDLGPSPAPQESGREAAR